MHEGPTLTWREVVDKYQSTMVDELGAAVDSLIAAEREAESIRAAAERERVKLATAESLNQIVRRIRQSATESAVLELLAEATSPYAGRAVVLSIENNQEGKSEARAAARRGVSEGDLTLEPSAAAAVAAVIETKDPVVALASESELSPAIAEAMGGAETKVYLFPLTTRQDVVAILVAAETVAPATLELLCGAAGLKMETLAPQIPVLKALPAPGLIQIEAPAIPATASVPEHRSWKDLSADDQKLHLQAQRVARVKVAEMRLYQAEQLRSGVASGNIYDALHTEIDNARTAFLQAFLSKSPTMVDYLHLELLRSLAHDDDRLLGENYPGPMV